MGKKVAIASIVLICIILFAYVAIPSIAILGEALLVRCDIHNPYVNSSFRGWNRAQIEDFDSFLLPDGWSVNKDSGIYWIIDNSGKAWAFGAIFGTDESSFSNYKDLIETALNTQCGEIKSDPFSRFLMMRGSDVDLLRIQGDLPDNKIFCVQLLENTQKELVWMVLPDLSLDEVQYDIAEAIVYSFAFDIKKTDK